MKLRLILGWPPTVNSYYSISNHGKYVSKRGIKYHNDTTADVQEQGFRLGLEGRLKVHVKLHPPDKRKRDLDNHMKALLDSLTKAGVWEDDELIDELHIYRGEIISKGKVVVIIEEIIE